MPIVADAAVRIAADLGEFMRDVKGLSNIRPVDVPVGADLDEFERDMRDVRTNKPIDVSVGADTDEFERDMRDIRDPKKVTVPVDADTTKPKKKFKELGDDGEKMGDRIKNAMDPKKLFGALAAAGALAIGIKGIMEATNAAAEFGDTVSATGVIFDKEAIPAMEEWAEKAASAFGASKQDALHAANSMAVFGKSAGLAGDDLIVFSQELTQLGGDLASMFGGRTEDAIAAVGSALRGEFEPIRQYGVLLDAATLQDAAFRAGIITTTDQALTPQQRVLAVHKAILEQTSDAQGDFARTSEGMANVQRQIAAQLENVTIEIGEELMPVMLELANWFLTDGIGALRAFVDYLKTAGRNIGEFVDGISDYVTTAQIRVGELGATVERHAKDAGLDVAAFKDLVIEGMTEMGLSMRDAEQYAEDVMNGVPRIMTDAVMDATAAWKEGDLAGGVAADVEGVPGAVAGALEPLPGVVADSVADTEAAFTDAFGDMISSFKIDELTGQIAVELQNGESIVGTSADAMMHMVGAAVDRARVDAMVKASGIPGAIGSALKDNAAALQPALDELIGIMNGSIDVMVDDAEIAAAQIALAQAEAYIAANPETAAAINSQMRVVQDILDEAAVQAKITAGLSGHATIEEQARAMALSSWLIEQEAMGIVDLQTDQWERAVDIATEKGYSTPEQFAFAMRQANGEVVSATDLIRGSATQPLESISDEAYGWGSETGWALANGLSSTYYPVLNAAGRLGSAIRGQIAIRSEPPSSDSPLRGITEWGGNIVRTIADGIYAELNTGSAAAGALASALVPAVNANDWARPGMAGAGVAQVIQYILNVEGKPVVVGTAQDIMDRWAQETSFSKDGVQ
jgi:hypothetical protein